MEITITKLTLAISTVSMLIALCQLIIALPKAAPRSAVDATNCANINRPPRLIMIWLLLNSVAGIFAYWFVVEVPSKLDIYMLALALTCGAMGYTMGLIRYLVR